MSAPDDDWESIPDPSVTIPFKRPKRPAPVSSPTPSPEPAAPRAVRRQRPLHLPSLMLGFSAGVLAASAILGLFFAAFTALS